MVASNSLGGYYHGVVEHSLPARKKAEQPLCLFLCLNLPDYRTFIEDYLKIVEFIEWLKENYPEKATFLTKKS